MVRRFSFKLCVECFLEAVKNPLKRKNRWRIEYFLRSKNERERKKRKETHLSQFNPVTVQRATGCKRASKNPWRTHQVPATGHESVVKINSINRIHTAASTAPKWISNKVFAVCCCCVCEHRRRVWWLGSTAALYRDHSRGVENLLTARGGCS